MVFLRKDRPGIGRTALALMVIVVVVVGGAIGISYPKSAQGAHPISTSTSSSLSASSSTALSSTPSSSVSSNTATISHPASAPLFNFVLDSEPRTILLSPGANLNYTTIFIVPVANKLQGVAPGNRGVGSELVVLNATAPSGLSLHFFGSNLASSVYIEVGAGGDEGLLVELTAAPSIAPGDYTIAIEASSGTLSVNYSLAVRVPQYLIIANYNAFNPSTLNVKVGSTVFWINLDSGNEATYTLTFDKIGVQSPVLNPAPIYDSFSHTFTTPGVYPYHCTCQVLINGTIVVTG